MAEKRWRLVCYDIRDPQRLRAVYKVVCGYGTRVQYSIYRARLDNRQLERLRWELSQVMEAEDALLIVDLCPSCASSVVSQNHVEGWTETPPSFQIVGQEVALTDQAIVDEDVDLLRDRVNGED